MSWVGLSPVRGTVKIYNIHVYVHEQVVVIICTNVHAHVQSCTFVCK